MAKKPFKVKSSSSEHFERSHQETGVGNSRVIAGGELCAVCHTKTVQNMNKKISLLLAIFVTSLFVIPQVTLAAWWNPGTWFAKERVFQSGDTATSTEQKDSRLKTFSKDSNLKDPNISDSAAVLMGNEWKNKPSEEIMDLGELGVEDVAKLKATILQLREEINLLQNSNQQVKKVIVEVPVEKIVYQDRIVEKPVEKIIYKNNATEKPVEKIVYQDRIVEKPVEKIIYRDKIIEKPVEKIVYQDRIVQTACSANSSTSNAPSIEYSDYNFDYKWNGSALSCPMTPRNIVIKKAMFQISDNELQKINNWKTLEADGFKVTTETLYPKLYGKYGLYSLEEKGVNTFVYFGGNIPVCGDGGVVSIGSMSGTLADISGSGRNIKAYLDQKGIATDDQGIVIQQNGDLKFAIYASPIMSEWEVWDNTTNKPVKIK